MKASRHRLMALLSIVSIGLSIALAGCGHRSLGARPDPREIAGVTNGEVSRLSPIKIVFAEPVGEDAGTVANPSPVALSPRTHGTATWQDPWTLAFVPDHGLTPDTTYSISFDPRRTRMAGDHTKAGSAAAPGDESTAGAGLSAFQRLKPFGFSVHVVPQTVSVTGGELTIPNADRPDLMQYSGTISFSDREQPDSVSSIVTLALGSRRLSIAVDGTDSSDHFTFHADAIQRNGSAQHLELSWNGAPVHAHGSGHESVIVPAKGTFRVLDVHPIVQDERAVEVVFSDPINASQNLSGLISSPALKDLRFSVQSNRVRVYSSDPFPSSLQIVFNGSIQNAAGSPLGQGSARTVVFPTQKPQVRFVGTGVIVPTTQGVTVPIETMNLNAVMVEAVQVYGSNIHQFLQVNQLNENEEIDRVGEVVWRKVVDLGWKDENLDHWVRYGLDISPLLKRDPGALYQLRITFRKPHIQYPGPGGAPLGTVPPPPSPDEIAFSQEVTGPNQQAEASNWDLFGGNYSYQYSLHRNDPLHPAYYQTWSDHDITATRNVMVSNIGLIAEQGDGPVLTVFSADLRDTAPLSGVSLTVYNYQRRALGQGMTDKNGTATIALTDGVPFFVLAQKDGQFGYLRVDDQSTLSISHFDTGGVVPTRGMQGFIYGERGVWRPGDPIYLTLLLDDDKNALAVGHPVGFELYDPRGTLADHEVLDYTPSGFYSLTVSTQPDAPTGEWTARFYVGGETYTKNLRIETVMPNRLKIALDFGGSELQGSTFNAQLHSEWLHGAIASNLKSDVKLVLAPTTTTFSGYPDFAFDDPTRDFESEPQTVFDGTLDAAGNARIVSPLTANNAPGKLDATVTTRVFEPGGAFSTEYVTVPYSPYARYVGVRLPKGDVARGILRTDQDQRADIVMLAADGTPVDGARVRVELFKMSWRWWWETDDENLTGYVARNSLRPLQTQTVNIQNGRGFWTFQIKYPDWGRFMLRVTDMDGGHSTAKIFYADWPGWAGHGQEDSSDGAAMLSLSVDHPKYNVGDMVGVSFPSTTDGRALATVEADGKILSGEWVTPSSGNTTYRFRATADMAPTAYVHITYLQPHLQTANDRPIRTYGVVPVAVEDPDTHLSPTISSADQFQPGERTRITVGESRGRAMTYTLAVVDEGLLGITNFQTPNPWDSFYQRRASTLKAWDLYDYVAGAFSGRLSTLLAIGGSDEGSAAGKRRVNRFEPVVLFFPPTTIRPGETHTHEFVMPQYIGAVRVMVVAGAHDAYGDAEKSVQVKKPVMVLGTLPRVIGPGEDVVVPVTVFAMDSSVQNATVSIETDGPLTVVGKSRDALHVPAPGESDTAFTLHASSTTGVAHVRLRAQGGGSDALQETEIAIRTPELPQSTVQSVTLSPGERADRAVSLNGIGGTNGVSIEISRIPPLDLTRRLDYLIVYPYGCIEQTTSSVFPQVNLDLVSQLSPDRIAEIQSNVRAAIDRLSLFQTNDGGFSFWPGEPRANEWGTNYAGDFLLEAKNRGYTVPDSLLSGWISYQSTRANQWSGGDALTQAYRLYTLAKAGAPEVPSMNRLRESYALDDRARWRLALAYELIGQTDAASALVAGARVTVAAYRELGNTFGSDLRDEAMILESLVGLQRDTEAANLARQISGQLTSDASWSTQSIAYALIAMSRFAVTENGGSGVSAAYRWSGGSEQTVQSTKAIATADVNLLGQQRGTVSLRNTTSATIFARVIATGVPQPGDEVSTANGLTLSVSYYDKDGTLTTPDQLSPGDDFRAIVAVTNTSRSKTLQNLALTQLVPSGWEIQNTRLSAESGGDSTVGRSTAGGGGAAGGGIAGDSAYTYRDIRDDRVNTYFDLRPGETRTYVLLGNASYRGRFYLPPVSVEAMYDPEVHATVKGQWITIGSSGR